MHSEAFPPVPDPAVFFESSIHQKAEEFILESLKQKDIFVLILGNYGVGKTSLCLKLVETFNQENGVGKGIYIPVPSFPRAMILKLIAKNIGLEPEPTASINQLQEEIFNYFETHPDAKDKIVLLFDDFQEYNISLIEHIKWLASFHTTKGFFPFTLLLFGHQSIIDKISNPQLGSFSQKIRKRFVLDSLDALETKEYIYFRLLNAGAKSFPLFPDDVIIEIHNRSGGLPRIINTICDACLIVGAREGKKIIDFTILDKALELLDDYRSPEELPEEKDQAISGSGVSEKTKPDLTPKPQPISIEKDQAISGSGVSEKTEPDLTPKPQLEPEGGVGRALGEVSARKEVKDTGEVFEKIQRYAKTILMIMLVLVAIEAAILVGEQIIKRFGLVSLNGSKTTGMVKGKINTNPLLGKPRNTEPDKSNSSQTQAGVKGIDLDSTKRPDVLTASPGAAEKRILPDLNRKADNTDIEPDKSNSSQTQAGVKGIDLDSTKRPDVLTASPGAAEKRILPDLNRKADNSDRNATHFDEQKQ